MYNTCTFKDDTSVWNSFFIDKEKGETRGTEEKRNV
jgi:hypothetical protein